MAEIIAYAITGLLMILGVVSLVENILCWLWKPKPYTELVMILPVAGNVSNIEQLIRYHLNLVKWKTSSQFYSLIIVDNGLDKETLDKCRIIMQEDKYISLYKPEELSEIF